MADKQVKKDTLKNEFELDDILNLFNLGKTKKYVREKLGISKSDFSYYLSKLELSGNIKRIGKYEVKVLSSSIIHPRVTKTLINSKLNKRGHAHNFKVIFPQEKEDLRNKPLIKNEIALKHIETLNFGSLKFSYKLFTIWINKSTLTIYSNNSYYSDDALISKFTALRELDNLIKYLKDKFQIKGIYGIEIFREHYSLIFNQFAEWILGKGGKMEVKDKGNKSILWVDDSKEDDIGLKEFESSNPLIVNNANTLFESHLRTSWKVTPEFTLEAINKLTNAQIETNRQILVYHEENKGHMELLSKWKKESDLRQKENIIWRKEESKKIKTNLKEGTQKSIFDYAI